MRQKEDIREDLKLLWIKELPFKFSFLAWRIWHGKAPVAVMMNTWIPNTSQLCNCCTSSEAESIEHLFLRGEVANTVWNYFGRGTGITVSFAQLKQTVKNGGMKRVITDYRLYSRLPLL